MNLFDIEREKYWSCPASYSKEKKRQIADDMINSGEYLCAEKIDGNWCCFVKQNGVAKMQTRGRSTITGEFGEVQDKVPHIFNTLNEYFKDDTFIIGELYYPGGNDKDVGSILRCLPDKAIARQEKDNHMLRFYIFDVWYIEGDSLMKENFFMRANRIAAFGPILSSMNKYIDYAEYSDADEATYSLLASIFERGGEGIVLQKKNGVPNPGKRTAKKSLKIKKEIENDLDVICIGYNPPIREYTGKDIEDWKFWEDIRTGERKIGFYYDEYISGLNNIEPVTKTYFYKWIGSIKCGVYKDGNIVHICDVSGLSDALKDDIANDPNKYYMKPMRITGMESTKDNSIRHPKFIGFRDDIDIKDCSWDKIF